MKFKYINLLFASSFFIFFIAAAYYFICWYNKGTCGTRWLVVYGILSLITGPIAFWKRKE